MMELKEYGNPVPVNYAEQSNLEVEHQEVGDE